MGLRPVSLLLVGCSSSAALAAQTSVSPTPFGRNPGPLTRVAYVSDEAQNDVLELYSVPLDGSAPSLRLNDALPTGGDVADVIGYPMMRVAGDRVVYVADQLTNDVHELFIVPVDGSAAPVRLNGPLVTGGDVTAFLAAKQRVVFIADGTVDERRELYSAPLDGSSPPIPLTPSLDPGFDVLRLVQFTGDESSLVFTVASLGGVMAFLHVVPTDGSQPPLLLDDSGPPPGFGYTWFPDIAIAPGDQQVVYIAVADDDETVVADIFSARLDGSTPPVQLNPGQGAVASFGTSPGFRIAPSGQRVLYVERGSGSDFALQSVRLDGSGLVDLVPAGEAADRRSYRISSDASFAVFATFVGSSLRLYFSALDGSQRVSLLGPITATIMGLELIPGDAGLIYATGTSSANVRLHALHAPHQPVALTGSPPAAQGANLSTTVGFDPLGFTPGGKRLVFRGDLHTDGVDELYSVLLDGSQPAQRLNPPLPAGRTVWSFRLAPGGRVLYLADQAANDRFELFNVPVDGSAAPFVLNPTPVTGGDVQTYAKPEPSGRLTRF